MSMLGFSAMGRVVRSGLGRKRLQTAVMVLTVLMAVTSSVVAGSLMVASSGPFDQAFAAQHGSQLTAQLAARAAGSSATPSQVDATTHLPGVTASAGPYPEALVYPLGPDSQPSPQVAAIVGRDTSGGPVDDLDLQSGRWAERPGEIVLSTDSLAAAYPLGSTMRLSGVAGGPVLTVVGTAKSVSDTADGWVVAAEISRLTAAGGTPATQMLYRFASAGTTAQVNADRAELTAALPKGSLAGVQSYLDLKLAADQNTATVVPIMMAFGVLGLLMSVIIIAGVVSGSVGASIRRIGILKSVGFTPEQVVRAYLAQALIPAAVGTALGVVLGDLLAAPLLGDAQQAYGTGELSVAWWIDLAVPAVAIGTVAIAALIPALRAGRMRTVEAITVGRAPRSGRGQWAHRAAGRLPLPRPVTLGLATPFAHPVRAAAMLAAVVFGTTAATFAVGLSSSVTAVVNAQSPDRTSAVQVLVGIGAQGPAGPGQHRETVSAADLAKVPGLIAAQPGTAGYYGQGETTVSVAGASGTVNVNVYRGDSSPGAYDMIKGHWLTGAGQIVVPTHFLASTGTHVGESITLVDRGISLPVRIVGEDFDPREGGMDVSADAATFASAEPGLQIWTYDITLRPGVSASAYVQGLNSSLQPIGSQAQTATGRGRDTTALVIEAMAVLLTLMLVAVAGLGVLNSVVLDTRERVHDLGVCKAVGMTPRQTVTQVLTSVAGLGVVGGLLGVPAGYAVHNLVVPLAMHAAGTDLPTQIEAVYSAPELALLGLAGLAIAVLGALLPAGWAAKARTAVALRTE